jgi:hypothetical protein
VTPAPRQAAAAAFDAAAREAEHGKGHGGSIGGGGPAARRNGMPDRDSIPLPRSEFVAAYVERHPEYRDLLA